MEGIRVTLKLSQIDFIVKVKINVKKRYQRKSIVLTRHLIVYSNDISKEFISTSAVKSKLGRVRYLLILHYKMKVNTTHCAMRHKQVG